MAVKKPTAEQTIKDKKTTIITLVVLMVILLLVLVYVLTIGQRMDKRDLATSEAAEVFVPDAGVLAYTDLEGKAVDLDQYLGQVMVVTSWASWSPWSQSELPLLAETVAPYSDQGVQLLAINRAEDEAVARSYLKSIGVIDEMVLVVDASDRYYQQIGGYTMPETLFYNHKGDVVAHEHGRLTSETIVANIEKALADQ